MFLTSVRLFLVLTADEHSTHVISIRIALRNWNVTAVFLKSLESMPDRTAISNGKI